MCQKKTKTKRNALNTLNTQGQGLTEYLILMLLISVVCIAAARSLGGTIKRKLQQVRNQIESNVTVD